MCVRSVDIMCYYVILVLDVYECDFLSLFCFCLWLFVVYFLYALGRPEAPVLSLYRISCFYLRKNKNVIFWGFFFMCFICSLFDSMKRMGNWQILCL